jgi:isopropylmalate/homocitrate/citramalate synthase
MSNSGDAPWKVPGKWSLSPYAFESEVRARWHIPQKITIHDVTLRDGEQTPGVVFRKEEKLKIAHALEDMGVQRIEGGMVAVSPEDFDALATMAREIKTSEVCGFCRARRDDIDLAIKGKLDWAIMEITALDPIIKNIWGSRGKAVEDIIGLTKHAKANGLKVCFFLMESARAPLDLIRELIVPVVEEGKADTVAIVDTRGSAYPEGFAWLVAQTKKMVKVPVEIHCHNNWGLATANTLAGISAGAEIAHTCINGMGANAPLDEIIMGTEAFLRVPTGVKTEVFRQLSSMVKDFSGAAGAEWYKPFSGSLTCQVEVGIATRQMWDRRNEHGYGRAELLNYEIVGGKAIEVVLGKKSGRYSIMLKSWEMGLPQPTEAQATEMLNRIKKISEDNKRLVTEEEFKTIYAAVVDAQNG